MYNHEDSDKPKSLLRSLAVRDSETNLDEIVDRDMDLHYNREKNDERRIETEAIHSYGHKDFDKLVQEDNNRRQVAGLHRSSEDFEKFVQKDRPYDNIFVKETGIHHSSNHEDFEKLVQEDVITSNRRDKGLVGASHEDFDNLVQEAENHEDSLVLGETNDFQDVDSFRQEISTNLSTDNLQSSLPKDLVAGAITEASTNPNNPHLHEIRNYYTVSFALAAFLCFFFLGANLVVRRRRAKRKISHEVYKCLTEFDVEDMELTKAVTGGWHGTYKNRLAEGFTDEDDDDTGSLDDDDFEIRFSGYSSDDNTIVFMEGGMDLLVADRNVYLASDEEYEDSDSDEYYDDDDDDDIYLAANDDVFTPVETGVV